MTYQTTITSKGQITIPKKLREALHLDTQKKLIVELEENQRGLLLRPTEDFLEVTRKVKIAKKEDPLKAREYMERHYARE